MSAIQTKILARVLSFLIVRGLIFDYGTVLQAQTPQGGPSYQGQGAPQTPAELQNLVSPIALYPDALVAQILSAATYPDQVAAANNWMQQNKNLTGSALMTAVNEQ